MEISSYLTKIHDDEDRPLFEEAVKAAEAGILRAAFIMIWLSCAESLKRRFKEAAKRDGKAGKVVGEILKKEKEHKAIDKFLIEQALEYGFLDDASHLVLNHVYEMRCIYGHPYEKAPSEEQVLHAAAVVISNLLSKPVKLREGFVELLINNMLSEKTYLDDQKESVSEFTKDILKRIDENVYGWMLEKLWEKLEGIGKDPSANIFFRRGIWFSQAFLEVYGVNCFNGSKWHEIVQDRPIVSFAVFQKACLFISIGKRAQDTFISSVIESSEQFPTYLQILEHLSNNSALNTRQNERFKAHISSKCLFGEGLMSVAGAKWLKSAKLQIKTVYSLVVKGLKSKNWYIQNPISEFISDNINLGFGKLTRKEQEELGRNILQAAEGSSGSACELLTKMEQTQASLPKWLISGILFECFVNNDNKLRFKVAQLQKVLNILKNTKLKDDITKELISLIKDAELKFDFTDKRDFDSVFVIIDEHKCLENLKKCLSNKMDEIFCE